MKNKKDGPYLYDVSDWMMTDLQNLNPHYTDFNQWHNVNEISLNTGSGCGFGSTLATVNCRLLYRPN